MSSEKLLLLLDPKYEKRTGKIVSSVKFEKILSTLADQFTNGNSKSLNLLRAVFLGLQEHAEINKRKIEIIQMIFTLSNTNTIETKIVSDLLGFLLIEVENMEVELLVKLVEFFLQNISAGKICNTKSLELFPKTLSVVSHYDKVPSTEGEVITGSEYNCNVINKICNIKWSSVIAVPMTIMMRDLQLTEIELEDALEKIIKMFKEVPFDEVPSLVYQILLLSVKGCKQKVLDGILTFFSDKLIECLHDEEDDGLRSTLLREEDNNNNNEKQLKELRSVEGTTLLHVVFAVRRDQELGREFVKYIKGRGQDFPLKLWSSFTIALMMSMTQLHRLEEPILDFLKSFILKVFKDDEHRKSSRWIRDLFPEHLPVEKNLLETAKDSKSGWDHVTQGLIHLSFMLIDTYTPKINDIFTITSDASTPTQRACILGAQLLQEIFKSQDVFREAILQQIFNSIITKTSVNQQHYLDLLSSLVSTAPQIVLDCLPKFREVFDYIPLVTVQTAEGLLRAVLPLMRVSMSIKDSLILILRKSMFSKNLEPKKIAVVGFLLILKHFKIDSENSYSLSSQVCNSQSFSCSQLDVPPQGRYNTAANEVLCLELIDKFSKFLPPPTPPPTRHHHYL